MSAAINDDAVWVGLDLGGTKMLSVIYDGQFKSLGRERKKTKGSEGAAAGVKRIINTITQALEKADVHRSRIAGIGVGCPGMLDLESGVLEDAPNLGWQDVPLRQRLIDEFGCEVVIGNDVDSGVFGEYRFGAGKNKRCVVGIFPGTGIGGGCVYEGKIFRGAKVTCMEIGHIPMVPFGPLDGCNNEGTLEALASRLVVASQAAQAAYRGQAPHLMEEAGTDLANIRSGALSRSVENGDEAVETLIKHSTQYLSQATVTIIHLLAPDVVVLGGGLVEAMPELFVKEVTRAVKKRVLPSFRDQFEIVAAELGDDAVVQGAAAWARQEIENNR